MHYKSTSTFFLLLHAHARGHSESGGDGGEHGNYDVQDFTPDFFVVHGFLFLMFFLHHGGHRVSQSFFFFIANGTSPYTPFARGIVGVVIQTTVGRKDLECIHWSFIANGTSPYTPFARGMFGFVIQSEAKDLECIAQLKKWVSPRFFGRALNNSSSLHFVPF